MPVARCITVAAWLLLALPSLVAGASLDSEVGGRVVYTKGETTVVRGGASSPLKRGEQINGGDEVRTGSFGALVIILRDETQIRLKRNSKFVIGDIRNLDSVKTTTAELVAGAMWSRAQSLARLITAATYLRPVVQIRTATSTIGIRGTDWYVSVDETTGTSRTVVISGTADVENAFGSVTLASGEEAVAEPGKAPVKRVIVDLKGRPLMALEYAVDWQLLAPSGAPPALQRAAELANDGDFSTAADLIDSLPSPSSDPAVEQFRVALLMNNSDYDAAIALATDAKTRFPASSGFDVLLGHAFLLTDQPEAMKAAIESGMAANSGDYQLWHLQGIYFTAVEPSRDEALAAYQRALTLETKAGESHNNLGLLNFQLGHFEAAKANLATAREVMPDSALVHGNSGFLAQNLDRLEDAEGHYQTAEALDAASPHLHMARGSQALMNGDHNAAIEHFLTAIAIQPVLPDAHTNLAIAYYQAGRFEEARVMIDKAIAIDPDDPVAPKVGTTMSLDQADIGRAVRLAKDALDKSLEYDYFAVESLESARSGITNLGAAYSSLGLTSWANYYAQLAFTPYEATSHFLLSNVYAARSNSATNGALNLGLVLAPTAISQPNRYFEFVREPGIDFTIGGSRGDEGGETTKSGSATVQGFARLPIPVSYRLDYIDTDRLDGHDESKSVNFSAGTRFGDRRHHLSINLFGLSTNLENDAPLADIDRGDRDKSSSVAASLAYHLRFDYENRIVARLGYRQLGTKSRNRRPFGSEISDLNQSLLINFGEDTTRGLIDRGLSNVNEFLNQIMFFSEDCAATDPCVGVGDFFAGLPFAEPIAGELPGLIAEDVIVSTDSVAERYYAQYRHMFALGPVDVSYGAEYFKEKSKRKFTFNNSRFLGVGALLEFDAMFNLSIDTFALFDTVPETTTNDTYPDAGFAYVQGRYEFTKDIWLEAGLFGRYYNDDTTEEQSQLDPRIGGGVRLWDKHWLRVAYQRELILPTAPVGPLAPVATMGFVPIVTQVLDGSSIKNIQAEWDAEWHERVFTSVRFEEQSIDGWSPLNAPISGFVFVDEARIRSIDTNLNLWLFERFGVFANYLHQWSENQDVGSNRGMDLPFIAGNAFAAGITYIHPKQIRANASINYVDERYGDLANSIMLDDYWTTNVSVFWQPLNRHASIGASVINLFDDDFDVAPGIRSLGRTAVISLQAQF